MVCSFTRGGRFCAVAAFVASALVGNAYANTLTVGPVEQVNLKNSTVVVLGQTYRVAPHTAGVSLASVSPGELVSISGSETASGVTRVDGLAVLPQQNVPGATTLLVTGIASAVNSVGQIHIGKLVVDITATITSDNSPVSAGRLVSVVGTQPSANGTFLAQSLGVGGTGAALNGVGGTGSSLGVGGTGSSLGVGGTGSSLGVGGTGVSLGVGGTGSSLGVGGTGSSLGVGGTGSSLGVGGTGSSLGVGGTGSSLGVGGTGSSLGVGGTGSSLGVGGTGSSLGVGGTGASL